MKRAIEDRAVSVLETRQTETTGEIRHPIFGRAGACFGPEATPSESLAPATPRFSISAFHFVLRDAGNHRSCHFCKINSLGPPPEETYSGVTVKTTSRHRI